MATRQRVEDWIKGDRRVILEDRLRNGAIIKDVAKLIGVSVSTVYKWASENSEFSDILKINRDSADAQVENALFNAAKNGNVTAMIFWLKNRRARQWRDKVEVDTNADALEKLDEMIKAVDRVAADEKTD